MKGGVDRSLPQYFFTSLALYYVMYSDRYWSKSMLTIRFSSNHVYSFNHVFLSSTNTCISCNKIKTKHAHFFSAHLLHTALLRRHRCKLNVLSRFTEKRKFFDDERTQAKLIFIADLGLNFNSKDTWKDFIQWADWRTFPLWNSNLSPQIYDAAIDTNSVKLADLRSPSRYTREVTTLTTWIPCTDRRKQELGQN